MHIKLLKPHIHGSKAYTNDGSARQAANYLIQEANGKQTPAVFFNAQQGTLSDEEAVRLLDENQGKRQKNKASFYSLVISPSAEELLHINNDPGKLRAYTCDVMQIYAGNFTFRDGRKLSEQDLVWVAIQHDERTARGTDNLPSGMKKPGLQTHVHVMVSARDRTQKTVLNPLGTVHRFNQIRFSATGNILFHDKFDYPLQQELPGAPRGSSPGQRANRIREKEAQIHQRLRHNRQYPRPEPASSRNSQRIQAGGQRVNGPLTEQQKAAREIRLRSQVERINKLVGGMPYLEFERVRAAAEARGYDKTFYSRLGRITREARVGSPPPDAYHQLREGRRRPPLLTAEILPAGIPKSTAQLEQEAGLLVPEDNPLLGTTSASQQGITAKLQATAQRMASALDPANRTQDVRGSWER